MDHARGSAKADPGGGTAGRRLRGRRLRPPITVAAVVAMAVLAAGCSAVPGQSSGGSTTKSSGTVTPLTDAQIAKMGKVTLRVATFDTGGPHDAFKEMMAAYHRKFPNVTFQWESKDFNSYGRTIKLQMSSSSAPDIAQANPVMARPLQRAGLIADASPYFRAYHWDELYPPGLTKFLRISADGKTFGSGQISGASPGGQLVGVFYNKQLLKQLGLQVPTTFDGFVHTLQVAKAKGVTGIELGNLEQWPATHALSLVNDQMEDKNKLRDWIAGNPGATYQTPGLAEAADTLAGWAKKGYISKNVNGTRRDDAVAAFTKGKSLYTVNGYDYGPVVDKGMGKNAGFFMMPPKNAGDPPVALGSMSNPMLISEKSQHKDLAAAFLNFMVGRESASIRFQNGMLPLSKDHPAAKPGTVEVDILKSWDQVYANDGLVPFLDWASDSMGDTMFPAFQEVLAGKQTGTQFTAVVQKDWNTFHQTK